LVNIWVILKGNQEALTKSINEFIEVTLYGAIRHINKDKSKPSSQNQKNKNNNNYRRKRKGRNKRKRYSYARCQELFLETPKRLADVVINNDQAFLQPAREPPEAAEVRRLYEDLSGPTGPLNAPIPGSRVSELSLREIFPPIAEEDVAERINKIRKKAAAGPDGFQKEYLLIPGLPTISTIIYNILCYCSYFPSVWKENRTTLIPKVNKPSSQVENWRPITIGPILCRIFSSLLDGRIIRGIVFNLRQKGFISESGCKININLFNAALSHCKKNEGGIFTIVDTSKAFDTVPHSALKPCLGRKGVPTPIINLISCMYDGNNTRIKSKNNLMVEIQILRGVKQGEPVSPLLFNLCSEPLLEKIEEHTSGININENRKVPVLAFADDVVLLGADEREAQRQVDVLHE
jgi:hypothetical protein